MGHILHFLFFSFYSFLALLSCKAAVCLRTVRRAIMERGRPTTTSSSMESIARSVAKAGVEGTVGVSQISALECC